MVKYTISQEVNFSKSSFRQLFDRNQAVRLNYPARPQANHKMMFLSLYFHELITWKETEACCCTLHLPIQGDIATSISTELHIPNISTHPPPSFHRQVPTRLKLKHLDNSIIFNGFRLQRLKCHIVRMRGTREQRAGS